MILRPFTVLTSRAMPALIFLPKIFSRAREASPAHLPIATT